MKQVYGFIPESIEDWGDIFEDDDKTPESLISSACHVYHKSDGTPVIGFDVSLNIEKNEMNQMLKEFCKKPKLIKVL